MTGAILEDSRGDSVNDDITTQVMQQLETLPEDLQRQVLDFVQLLHRLAQRGTPGKELVQFAGTIPQEDLALMSQAIEQGCEQTNQQTNQPTN